MNGEIRVLCLDLGGVVVHVYPEHVVDTVAKRFAKEPSDLAAYFHTSGIIEAYETGALDSRSFHERLQKDWNIEWGYEDFKAVWISMLGHEPVTQRLLENLAGKIPIMVLSNINDLHLEYVRDALGLLRHVDPIVASFEVGFRKPDPEIFRHAIAVSGADPETILYFDDRPEMVAGARAQGIRAVRCPSPLALPQLVETHLGLQCR